MDEERRKSFGGYLKNLRTGKKLSLRAVEQLTDKKVSNGYLSQLESGQVSSPSPNILFAISQVYGVEYQSLMERVGYISPDQREDSSAKHGRAATFAVENLTSEEEQALLNYLEFIRKQKGG